MERKNRTVIALVIATVIVAAVLSSFGLPMLTGSPPRVELPDISAPAGESDGPGGENGLKNSGFVRVDVTPETVQNVIATLDRPASYYREITVEHIWGEEEDARGVTHISVWAADGYTYSDAVLPGGLVQHTLVDGTVRYLWYGNDQKWHARPADEKSADIEAQHIPSYEDVLELEQSAITGTGYELLGEFSCIYIEVEEDTLGYRERYWVDVQSGLLVAAEKVKEGRVTYRMTSNTLEIPVPEGVTFGLPDGTVLYENVTTGSG
ncbi:MAG: hypothetical protein GX585_01020 [Clostridiales bacterium]|nr:hypothetical protein [Clostridiales bacterium]